MMQSYASDCQTITNFFVSVCKQTSLWINRYLKHYKYVYIFKAFGTFKRGKTYQTRIFRRWGIRFCHQIYQIPLDLVTMNLTNCLLWRTECDKKKSFWFLYSAGNEWNPTTDTSSKIRYTCRHMRLSCFISYADVTLMMWFLCLF